MGRKSKLTPELQAEICKWISAGNTKKTACQCAGIDESTLYLWLQAGEKATSGKFFELFNAIKKAQGQAKARLVLTIQKAGQDEKHWQANAWLLERSYADEYAQKIKADVAHSGKVELIIGTSLKDL